tara:strand:+ start:10128 stop:10784 length:657 start_codon:yes stop_codon:yes gene_type:complete
MTNHKDANLRRMYDKIKADLSSLNLNAAARFTEYVRLAREDALTDSLTKLPNRELLLEQGTTRLTQAIGQSLPIALYLADIDNFKAVNDRTGFRGVDGYDGGDLLLEQTGVLLRQSIRPDDVAGRYGGEEFVVLGFNTDEDGAEVMASRLLERMSRYHDKKTLSMGIATRNPAQKGTTLQELIAEANVALKVAKGTGKDKFVFYKPGMVAPELPARTN